MRIALAFELDEDWETVWPDYPDADIGARYENTYDDVKSAAYAWNMNANSYARGKSLYHAVSTKVEYDDGSAAVVEINGEWTELDLVEDVLAYADELHDEGSATGDISVYVEAKEEAESAKKKAARESLENAMKANDPALIAQAKLKGYVCAECGEWLEDDNMTSVDIAERQGPQRARLKVTYACAYCGHKDHVLQIAKL